MRRSDATLIKEGLPPTYILILAHLLFIPLFVLSFIYYKERLFGDSAWYLFRVVNTENFVIEHSRPSLYLWQWFIILLAKAGVVMSVLLRAYSVYHVAFFYLTFVVVVHILKDFRSGLFVIGFQLLGVSDMFFCWPMWEMWYGLAVLILQIALTRADRNSLLIHFILTLFIFMSYPFNIIVWCASWVLIFPEAYIRRHLKRLLLLFAAGILLKLSWGNSYESQKLSHIVDQGMAARMRSVCNVHYIHTFFHFYFFRYTLVSVSVLISAWILRKQKFKLFAFISLVSAAAFIINLAYGKNEFGSDGPTFEAIYYLIPVFTLLALVYNFSGWRSMPGRVMTAVFMMLITVVGCRDIVRVSDVYRERVLLMERTICRARIAGQTKVAYYDDNIRRFNYHYCMFSMPMESMMLSSCEPGKRSVSIAEEHMMASLPAWHSLDPDQYIMMNEFIFNISSLNKKYFDLAHESYTFLNRKDCKSDLNTNGLMGTVLFDHCFNTDYLKHNVYHVSAALAPGMALCSRDTSIYWEVETENGKGAFVIHSRQPLSRDAVDSVDDYVVIATDSLPRKRKSYLGLVANSRYIGKIPIP